ncbi:MULTISPECIES: hypothetical protein [unclassified Novosphingobium]|uniref:hypothetical protein n=1 Tax=unclassified Novosphingobium TaxID=2644732 RepID=UPI000D31D9DC|nr:MULTISPECIES: hypothetical protein [unclassified Novosphingobium]PTR11756.1 hypothetical protein C8K11_104115 [Novosphingobium sp. GV055]PUB04796.1 hypothetical protein C8K12_104115 [Novosphingobium sp. GV061]PUB21115.1 hypothetical protein C8K14_104115 [Novosphingobium sp. GV079]PUB42841.1 hypothetical protein C8K10_104115 [Novosphingobium sp. GV027]
MPVFDWPASLIPKTVTIRPPRRTVGMSGSLTDFTQAVPSIRPPFTLTMQFDAIEGFDVLAYRAIHASLEGRANMVRVPLFDVWYAATQAEIMGGMVTHSDGTAFSDGALYLTRDLSGVLVSGLQGARTITADFGGYGQLLQAGLYFGLGEHPYIATGVSWSGSVATIRCSPSLRKDYDAEPLRLRPTMIGRLPDDDNGALTLEALRYGTPSIEFTEAFDEPFS